MKFNTTRILSLLLSLCLLIGSFTLTACSDPTDTPETGGGETTGEASAETEDPRATLDNPEVDYDGYVFRVRSIASDTH